MKLSELPNGENPYTQLGTYVLAVLSVRPPGEWCIYVDSVTGYDHSQEWAGVLLHGAKQQEDVACAILENLFHPGFEVDLPYAR